MAAYTERLQAPLLARLEAQAELIGSLKAELAAAQARLAEGGPEAQQGAPPADVARTGRPWWRRMFFWELSGA